MAEGKEALAQKEVWTMTEQDKELVACIQLSNHALKSSLDILEEAYKTVAHKSPRPRILDFIKTTINDNETAINRVMAQEGE